MAELLRFTVGNSDRDPRRKYHIKFRDSRSIPYAAISNCGKMMWRTGTHDYKLSPEDEICKICLRGPLKRVIKIEEHYQKYLRRIDG